MTKTIKTKKPNNLSQRGLAALVAVILIAGVAWLKVLLDSRAKNTSVTIESTSFISSISTLLALPVEELSHVDIARMNLLCAQGLPGAADLDVNGSLPTLDQMAARVRAETERNFHRFQSKPAEF